MYLADTNNNVIRVLDLGSGAGAVQAVLLPPPLHLPLSLLPLPPQLLLLLMILVVLPLLMILVVLPPLLILVVLPLLTTTVVAKQRLAPCHCC